MLKTSGNRLARSSDFNERRFVKFTLEIDPQVYRKPVLLRVLRLSAWCTFGDRYNCNRINRTSLVSNQWLLTVTHSNGYFYVKSILFSKNFIGLETINTPPLNNSNNNFGTSKFAGHLVASNVIFQVLKFCPTIGSLRVS